MKKKILLITLSLVLMFPFFCLGGCDNDNKYFSVLVQSSNVTKGTVLGAGVYKNNETIRLTAKPIDENTFIAWVKNGYIVSYEADFSFVSSANTQGTYIALFETDNLEFSILKDVFYEVSDLEIQNTTSTLYKLSALKIDMSLSQSQFTKLAEVSNQEITTDGGFYINDFNIEERLFYFNKTYYFKTNLILEYINPETSTSSLAEITTNFVVDFNNLKTNGIIEENTLTYTNENYTLKQTQVEGGYTIDLTINCLSCPQTWTEDTIQKLNLKFVYPFNLGEEEEEIE